MMARDRGQELSSQALASALQSSFRLLQLAMVAILIYILFTGLYIVKQDEVAVVMRLGRVVGAGPDRIRQPGLHLGFPYPIDEVIRVPEQQVLSVESTTHWYQLSDAEKELQASGRDIGPGGPTLRPLVDGYTLTGDANILHSQWKLQYRIVDPIKYALDFAGDESEPGQSPKLRRLLRAALDNAVVQITARYETDAAQRTATNQFREDVQNRVVAILAKQDLGCSVERVEHRRVDPPRQVKAAFEAVVRSEQDKDRIVSEAKAHATELETDARGMAARTVAEAAAIAERTKKQTEADAAAFRKILPTYLANPNVVRKTLWLDTLDRVYANADEKIVINDAEELRILLGRDPQVVAQQGREAAKKRAEERQRTEAEASAPAFDTPPSPPPDAGGGDSHAGHGH